jgi:polysaccharide pyruvyl transferase WcaK-like protein
VKIGFITTLDTNIGDDFIREGLFYVLSRIDRGFTPVLLNKHEPCHVYPSWHPLHWPVPFGGRMRRYYHRALDAAMYRFGGSRFDACDAIIQSGAPVYFNNCASMEWSKMIWEHVACRLAAKIPVLNIAAGSCYPWERIPGTFADAKDRCFIKAISSACRLTTVRDALSQRLLHALGFDVSLIPCSAILAAKNYPMPSKTQKYVFFNYMRRGTHFDFDQDIDADKWEGTMRCLVACVKQRHPVAFICHSQEEYRLAEMLDHTVPRFFPQTVAEYFAIAAMGIAGVFNRMHAAVGFAGLGIPSVGVGGDTRMLMVDALGLDSVYVKSAEVAILEEKLESLIRRSGEEKDRLVALQTGVLLAYERAIAVALDCR